MTHRTTFALDRETADRLRRLAGAWHVSQAEVVRRAVAIADEAETGQQDPTYSLRALHDAGKLLVREEADEYLAENRRSRRSWRGEK
jgi:predicted transcriptional regulator